MRQNNWPDGFPPIREGPPVWAHFLIAYFAGVGSEATVAHWTVIVWAAVVVGQYVTDLFS